MESSIKFKILNRAHLDALEDWQKAKNKKRMNFFERHKHNLPLKDNTSLGHNPYTAHHEWEDSAMLIYDAYHD